MPYSTSFILCSTCSPIRFITGTHQSLTQVLTFQTDNQLLEKDVHFSTYLPDCPQCIGTLHRHRHGGPRNTSPVSTPTTQSSNCPNYHTGQHLRTHSRFPCPLPQPISIPTTG